MASFAYAATPEPVRTTEVHAFAALVSTTLTQYDFLGWSVAIAGDAIVVGAQGDDRQQVDAGAAYVFTEPVGGWSGEVTESAVLLPSDGAAGDRFGWASAADGDVVVIAARDADPNGADSGAAYVFVRPGGGWAGTLNESARLLPSDGMADDNFGFDVAIDGDTVVVGSRYDDDVGASSGSVYVFTKPPSGWWGTVVESAKLLVGGGAAGDELGTSVSISGDVVVSGAPRRDHAAVDSGAAYLFIEPPGGWYGTLVHSAVLVPSDGEILDDFGNAVAVLGDGVLVGCHYDDSWGAQTGSGYWFTRPTGGWSGLVTETAWLISDAPSFVFGEAVALSELGAAIGAPFDPQAGTAAGAVFAAPRPDGDWAGSVLVDVKLLPAGPVDEDYLGRSVEIAGDVIVAGASSAECAAGIRCGVALLFGAPWVFADGFESGDMGQWTPMTP
jgi:hypothetical protein